MKKRVANIAILAVIVAGTCGWALAQAKEEAPDRAIVPLTDPAKPAKIEVSIMRGSITVKGYAGKDVIGEVDVNPDGSAYFQVPSGVPLYFMALDKDGKAVQRMRSFTHLMPGEVQGCVGCHKSRLDSPLRVTEMDPAHPNPFVSDDEFIPLHITHNARTARPGNVLFEKAGPREKVFFDAAQSRAAIVTCGGLCPGLNNVIRSLVLSLRCH